MRAMALTPELIARIHRDEPEVGPLPGTTPMTDADFAAGVAWLMGGLPADDDLHVFAYGSLIWRPACEHEDQTRARLTGWHRSFCFRVPRFRGTPDQPGLMLALDRGGSCIGVVQRHARARAADRLERVLRREMTIRETPNQPRWVTVTTADGARRRAIAFAADRRSFLYCGHQPAETTVAVLANAIGHVGSCAEYLMKTVTQLESLGIHDPYLWRLQDQVAARIMAETEAERGEP
ncbi:MAG: gamma-glutamylcyclotransferase [Alphaproteobacteria bacterium]|nr:gamma-glutamylcyclotransferase [Alphaproteobacteria bacterium]